MAMFVRLRGLLSQAASSRAKQNAMPKQSFPLQSLALHSPKFLKFSFPKNAKKNTAF
jgi:hypothetical protein